MFDSDRRSNFEINNHFGPRSWLVSKQLGESVHWLHVFFKNEEDVVFNLEVNDQGWIEKLGLKEKETTFGSYAEADKEFKRIINLLISEEPHNK